MKKAISILSGIILLVSVLNYAYPEGNSCNDRDSWIEWNELLEKHPYDMDIQTLHALRVGLCLKVERGDLSVEQVTEIFENARRVLVLRRIEEKKDLKPPL